MVFIRDEPEMTAAKRGYTCVNNLFRQFLVCEDPSEFGETKTNENDVKMTKKHIADSDIICGEIDMGPSPSHDSVCICEREGPKCLGYYSFKFEMQRNQKVAAVCRRPPRCVQAKIKNEKCKKCRRGRDSEKRGAETKK
jgi:hypothetical protein